ncbi:U-scoloptoxin(05)-Sm1a [Frankliniella occidentalis]|uniref:U-scoloptoxin(05)-Sm1a n=1 Tax=Frankliniella occidentalis TaxID=133901 RepID=A0A9C6U3B9_FRAOC|nr:U-scoloptoxin(05)-Sm1a [Frankliniella occidentalis]
MESRWTLVALTAAAIMVLLVTVVPTASGLKCFQCGFYTDGVGSITPCINHTVELHLKECPKEKSKSCLKYVSEGITVLACSDDCVEKESSWGGYHYCCKTDACNSASARDVVPALLASVGVLWGWRMLF